GKTAADYEALPEGAPYQLIAGAFIHTPSRTITHQLVLGDLLAALAGFIEGEDLGEVVGGPIDVYLAETDAYQPDIVFISRDRMGIVGDYVHGAPDLVMEVLSPETAYYDLTRKKRVYAASGVAEYWIVDPIEQTVEVMFNIGREYERVSDAYRTGHVESRLLTGFIVDVERLFAVGR
ncbi:MAG TPA: Uma2 family endonuclease, partial [Rhodothermales bacterium]|nr:Uma2 family endonuclease [Rhodothermales bacterium]